MKNKVYPDILVHLNANDLKPVKCGRLPSLHLHLSVSRRLGGIRQSQPFRRHLALNSSGFLICCRGRYVQAMRGNERNPFACRSWE
jgi:hypothetical protein